MLSGLENRLADGFPVEQLVLLSDPDPFGISREKWTERWWIWLNEIPKPSNPANDSTGVNCAKNQTDSKMWFLAGTLGGIVRRECIVPEKAILFPIINSVHLLAEPSFKSEAELEAKVSIEADNAKDMRVTIDGLQLSDLRKHRVHTRPFDVTLPEDNIWGKKSGPTRAAADGYWIFLRSLSPGRHTIRFFGSDLDGFETGVTYDLTVNST